MVLVHLSSISLVVYGVLVLLFQLLQFATSFQVNHHHATVPVTTRRYTSSRNDCDKFNKNNKNIIPYPLKYNRVYRQPSFVRSMMISKLNAASNNNKEKNEQQQYEQETTTIFPLGILQDMSDMLSNFDDVIDDFLNKRMGNGEVFYGKRKYKPSGRDNTTGQYNGLGRSDLGRIYRATDAKEQRLERLRQQQQQQDEERKKRTRK